MRTKILVLGVSSSLALSYLALAAPPATGPGPLAPIIGTQQIDRYDAIAKLRARLDADPKSLVDWIILGELAQEVAMNLPEDQARGYLRTSRQAYEKASSLAPDNAGITAATEFARDLEAHVAEFEKSRDLATETYLEARRRDLAQAGYTPAIAVYAPPAPPTAPVAPAVVPVPAPARQPAVGAEVVTNPPLKNEATTDNANFGARLYYGTLPTYRSFTNAGGAAPYTYQEYRSAYYPPGYYANPAVPPITLQRFGQSDLRAVTVSPGATPPVRPE